MVHHLVLKNKNINLLNFINTNLNFRRTKTMNKSNSLAINFVVSAISIVVTLILMSFTTSDKDDVEHLKESNKFKYELIQHQQKLIKYQDVMISSLGDVLWNEYGYDLPQFDGEEQDNIDIEKEIIDSLYKSQQ